MPHVPLKKTLLFGAFFLGTAPLSADVNYMDLIDRTQESMDRGSELISDEFAQQLRNPEQNKEIEEIARNLESNARQAMAHRLDRMDYDADSYEFEFYEEPPEDSERDAAASLNPDSDMHDLLQAGEIRFVMFLSFSMSDTDFRESMRALEGFEDQAVAVIAGLADPEHTLQDTMIFAHDHLRRLGIQPDESAGLYIEPEFFTDLDVTEVPKLVLFDGAEPQASVRGLPNIEWLKERFERGETGDHGVYGNQYPVQEENFMVTLERRANAIDGEQQIQNAKDNFWAGQSMYDLPKATETQAFLVDMTVTLQTDIVASNGQVMARAGDTINPLEAIPFPRVGLVFDGTDEAQVKWAQKHAEKAISNNLVPIVMSTQMDSGDDSWDYYEKLNSKFRTNVFMANADIINRFSIEKVPSRFEQSGSMIKVTEFALEEME